MQKTISIGTLARRTGVAVSALRFYEEKRLVFPERNAGGQRRFLKTDIRRVSFILIAQKFGFTLPMIAKTLSTLPEGRTPSKADWAAISAEFRTVLDEKIETLTQFRDNLDGCIGCGCLSLDKCKLYNPEDRAAKHGPGPRYLMGNRPNDQG